LPDKSLVPDTSITLRHAIRTNARGQIRSAAKLLLVVHCRRADLFTLGVGSAGGHGACLGVSGVHDSGCAAHLTTVLGGGIVVVVVPLRVRQRVDIGEAAGEASDLKALARTVSEKLVAAIGRTQP